MRKLENIPSQGKTNKSQDVLKSPFYFNNEKRGYKFPSVMDYFGSSMKKESKSCNETINYINKAQTTKKRKENNEIKQLGFFGQELQNRLNAAPTNVKGIFPGEMIKPDAKDLISSYSDSGNSGQQNKSNSSQEIFSQGSSDSKHSNISQISQISKISLSSLHLSQSPKSGSFNLNLNSQNNSLHSQNISNISNRRSQRSSQSSLLEAFENKLNLEEKKSISSTNSKKFKNDSFNNTYIELKDNLGNIRRVKLYSDKDVFNRSDLPSNEEKHNYSDNEDQK